jgi:hypothetical protein
MVPRRCVCAEVRDTSCGVKRRVALVAQSATRPQERRRADSVRYTSLDRISRSPESRAERAERRERDESSESPAAPDPAQAQTRKPKRKTLGKTALDVTLEKTRACCNSHVLSRAIATGSRTRLPGATAASARRRRSLVLGPGHGRAACARVASVDELDSVAERPKRGPARHHASRLGFEGQLVERIAGARARDA